jgi:hypothetical protein
MPFDIFTSTPAVPFVSMVKSPLKFNKAVDGLLSGVVTVDRSSSNVLPGTYKYAVCAIAPKAKNPTATNAAKKEVIVFLILIR